MPATNDFLPVAIDAGNNAEAQVSYAGSTEQLKGWPDDSFPPANRWNKMLRQATCWAAIVSQVICNLTGTDMLDNGDQITKIAAFQSLFRTRLTGATTFYVSTGGNDSTGDGSAGNPWRTGQHAVDTILAKYDCANNGVTISRVDSNAYTDPVLVTGRLVGQAGAITFTASSSANVTVTVGTAAYCYEGFLGAAINVQNQKLINSVGGALYASQNGTVSYSGINFGACTGTAILADRSSRCISLGACTWSGNCGVFASADGCSTVELGGSLLTIAGTPTVGISFANASDRAGVSAIGTTFAGTFIGKRYHAELNSVINTNSGNINFFPGTVAGDAITGSQYA